MPPRHPTAFARLFTILAIAWSGASYAPDGETWTPDLATAKGRLTLLQSILARHPNVLRRNLQFRRNLLGVMQDFDSARTAAGEQAVSLDIGETTLRGARFFAVTDVQYNEPLLGKLRAKIKKDLELFRGVELRGFKEDLAAMKADPTVTDFKGRAAAFIRAAPFLYDSTLKPRLGGVDVATRAVEEATPSDLQNRYFELMRDSIKPGVDAVAGTKGMGEVGAVLNNVESNFVQKEVRSATEGRTPAGATATLRAVSIERAAAPIAVMRGCFGGDCSILSVPHYPSLKGTKTFLVRKSMRSDAEPDGYVFVAEVVRNGKIVPYIVTINGETLQSADVQAVIHLVAEQYGSNGVMVGDLAKQPHLVNTDAVRSVLSPKKKTATKVALPEGWGIFKDPKYRAEGYANYYAQENLENGYWVDLAEIPFRQEGKTATTTIKAPYLPVEDVKKIARMDRAVLAAHAIEGMQEGRRAFELELQQELNLTPAEIHAGEKLVQHTPNYPISKAQFAEYQATLGVQVNDLMSLDLLTRIASLSQLHKEAPELAKAEEWKRFFKRSTDQLDREVLVEVEGQPGRQSIRLPTDHRALLAWIDGQLAVPIEFRSPLLASDEMKAKMAELGTRDLGDKAIAHLSTTRHRKNPLAQEWLKAIGESERDRAFVSDVATRQPKFRRLPGGPGATNRWIAAQRALPENHRSATPDQLRVGERLAYMSSAAPLDYEEFRELNQHLAFEIQDVETLPPEAAVASFALLRRQKPDLIPAAEWKTRIDRAVVALDEAYLQTAGPNGERLPSSHNEKWVWIQRQFDLPSEMRSPHFSSAAMQQEIVGLRDRSGGSQLLEDIAKRSPKGDATVLSWFTEIAKLENARFDGPTGEFVVPKGRDALLRWFRTQKVLPQNLRSPHFKTSALFENIAALLKDEEHQWEARLMLVEGIAEIDAIFERGELSPKVILALIDMAHLQHGEAAKKVNGLIAKAAKGRVAATDRPAEIPTDILEQLKTKLKSNWPEQFGTALDTLLKLTEGKEIPKELAEILEKRLRAYDEKVMATMLNSLSRARKFQLPDSMMGAITDIASQKGSGPDAARAYLLGLSDTKVRLSEAIVEYMAEGFMGSGFHEKMARWLLTTHADSPIIRTLHQQLRGVPTVNPDMSPNDMKKLFNQKVCQITHKRIAAEAPKPRRD